MQDQRDKEILFAASLVGVAPAPIEAWLATRSPAARGMTMVGITSDMARFAVECRDVPTTDASDWAAAFPTRWGFALSTVTDGVTYLRANAPVEGLLERRVFGVDGADADGELLVEASLSAQGASAAMDRLHHVSAPFHAFLAELASFDGTTAFGWRFAADGVKHHIAMRRVAYTGGAPRAVIGAAIRTLIGAAFADLPTGATWGAFAESSLGSLRPGEAPYTLEARIETTPDGRCDAVVLDFFVLPTRVAVSLVQAFNLATDKLEALGAVQGALAVEPDERGMVWVDRVRATYGRSGLAVELGHAVRS